MPQRLFLFQIGPVQSFIAAARRTEDLYVGSRMLSELAGAGVRAAHNAGSEMIFPYLDSGELPEGVPHRFAFLSDVEPAGIAKVVGDAVRNRWLGMAGQVKRWLVARLGADSWENTFDRQVQNWLEIYWVAVPYDAQNHGASYMAADSALAARKSARQFVQVEEPGAKCTLTGAQSALGLDWTALQNAKGVGDIVLRDNERLGAIALIKRLAQIAGALKIGDGERTRFASLDDISDENQKGGVPYYIAVLHMDGDRMGKRLSAQKTIAQHREISKRLAQFADTARDVVDQHKGYLVYAGGDDVLALLSPRTVLQCADQLQQELTKALTFGNSATPASASTGIAITATNFPFDQALETVRDAEHAAKEAYGRAAIVVRDVRGTAIREAGTKWRVDDEDVMQWIAQLQSAFADGELSGKIGYDLVGVAHDMALTAQLRDARVAELRRLLKRRTGEGVRDERRAEILAWAEPLARIADSIAGEETESENGWESLAHWAILARFLNQIEAGKQ